MNRLDETTTCLTDIESVLAILYRQSWPWVHTSLENDKDSVREELQVEMMEYTRDLYSRIDVFESLVSAWFSPNLDGIRKEVAMLHAKVYLSLRYKF